MNIQEDYVSFETAKLMKEKGFDSPCECFYDTEHNDIYIVNGWTNISNSQLEEEREFLCYSAPTLQMAIKWLRKTYKIFFNVNYYNLDIGNEWLQLRINRLNKIGCEVSFEGFDPEEQYEKAIKYCLENLI